MESEEYTEDQIEAILVSEIKDVMNDKNQIDVDLVRIHLKRKYKIIVGHNKAYYLKKLILHDHPEIGK